MTLFLILAKATAILAAASLIAPEGTPADVALKDAAKIGAVATLGAGVGHVAAGAGVMAGTVGTINGAALTAGVATGALVGATVGASSINR